MSSHRPIVLFAILGALLDRAKAGEDRWQRWRPNVAVCQHEELLISRFELFHDPKELPLARVVVTDIQSVSPETEVRLHETAP